MSHATLYLHIGLPKTATTHLQNVIFPQIPHLECFGMPTSRRFAAPEDGQHGGRLLIACLDRSPQIWRDLGDDILQELLGPRGLNPPVARDVLISEEGIGRAGSRPHLLQAHLEALAQKARAWGFGQTKVLCTFRRQDRWLASHYAQVSDRNPTARQSDFEATVGGLLDPYHSKFRLGMLLDYEALHDALAQAVGGHNVLMLPYELLTDEAEAFYGEMLEFLATPSDLVASLRETFAALEAKENVRRQSEQAWTLRPYRGESRLSPKRLARLVAPNGGPGRAIRLTPEITGKVLAAYRESNERLAQRLSRDLGQFGYL